MGNWLKALGLLFLFSLILADVLVVLLILEAY